MYEAFYGLREKPFSILPDPDPQDALLPWILMSLNQPFEGSHPALFKQFERFLYEQAERGRRTILIVDEAQNIGPEALEELRMLSNINTDKQQILQIILVGQPQLKELLRAPQLLQFAQRISSDFHLRPLNAHEVSEYIDFRLRAVGAHSALFSDSACSLIADTSRGIPRTINILCDTALVYGFASEAEKITAELVDTVIKNKAQFGVLPFDMQPSLGVV